MSVTASRVFAAWADLDISDRDEVVQLINKYQRASSAAEQEKIALEHIVESHRSFVKSSTTMNFGPAPGSCPTCGR